MIYKVSHAFPVIICYVEANSKTEAEDKVINLLETMVSSKEDGYITFDCSEEDQVVVYEELKDNDIKILRTCDPEFSKYL